MGFYLSSFCSNKFNSKMANNAKLVALLLIVGLAFAVDLPQEKLLNTLQKLKKDYRSLVPERVNQEKRGANYISNNCWKNINYFSACFWTAIKRCFKCIWKCVLPICCYSCGNTS